MVPDEKKSADMCRHCVVKDVKLFQHVPQNMQTPEMVMYAMRKSPKLLEYVSEQYLDLAREVIRQELLEHFKNDPETTLYAVKRGLEENCSGNNSKKAKLAVTDNLQDKVVTVVEPAEVVEVVAEVAKVLEPEPAVQFAKVVQVLEPSLQPRIEVVEPAVQVAKVETTEEEEDNTAELLANFVTGVEDAIGLSTTFITTPNSSPIALSVHEESTTVDTGSEPVAKKLRQLPTRTRRPPERFMFQHKKCSGK